MKILKSHSDTLRSVFLLQAKGLIVLGATLCLLLAPRAHAVPIRVSQIVGFSSGNLGSVGTSEGWAGSSGNYTVESGSGSLDGVPLGLYPSAGDKVDIAATSITNSLNTYNNFASSGDFPPSLPINLYYSFLYRFNSVTNMGSTFSNKVVQVNRLGSSSGVHFELHALTNNAGKIQLGIMKPGGVPEYAPTTVEEGQVFFVVLRQQIIAGSANDQIDLWINPPLGSFGAEEWAVPVPDASTLSGTEDPSSTGPGRFYIIAGVSANFDELRIATNSWADVTPSTSSCVPASFDSQPTDVSVSEGISATFSVSSSSSSPVYQWQVSTNGGTDWQDVVDGEGIMSSTYTTAPLSSADDGNLYRCVIIVSCGGGSTATSDAAVVSVSPAVVTPIGVVVDDTFADLSRNNTPIDPSNSVWFASAAASLSDGSTGNLIGTPGSGTSRLWLSYFTDDTTTNLPVHLAVGRAIQATLTFRASNIVSNGGNSMRFGLFDYADGGTRVTGDGFGSGSTGNGTGVRGYMLTLNFGSNFSTDRPEALLVRNTLSDNNLMGSSGDYRSLGSGPAGATLNGAPALLSDTDYTLDLSVTRSAAATTIITASLTGGGTNYTTTVIDSTYAYPRFDAFAMRPNSLETTADSFTISRLTVQVVDATPVTIPLDISPSDNGATLTWSNPVFTLQASPEVNGIYTNVPAAQSPYAVPTDGVQMFYRLIWSP